MARKRSRRANTGTGASTADDVARLAVAGVFVLVLTGTAGTVLETVRAWLSIWWPLLALGGVVLVGLLVCRLRVLRRRARARAARQAALDRQVATTDGMSSRARLEAALQAGDPGLEVTVAWHAYQDLRSMFHAPTPATGRAIAQRVIDSFHRCPIPEIARLGRTLRSWRVEVLAYFDDDPLRYGISNGGTEAINLIIEKTRRLAHGFRNFSNYRIRILLAADGTRPWRRRRGSG